MRSTFPVMLLMFIFGGLSSTVHAVTPGVLYGPELEGKAVHVTRLTDHTLSYFDEQRQLRSQQVSDLVRLHLTPSRDEQGDVRAANAHFADHEQGEQADAWLALTDGQMLPGRLRELASDGQSFVWEHPTLGRFDVDLQGVAALHLRPQPLTPTRVAGDAVMLRNGDRLEGFVSGLGPEGLRIVPAGADESMTLAMNRWQWVRLGNEPIEKTYEPYMVMLTDGSRVLAQSVELRQDTVYLALHGQLPAQPPTQVSARVLELPVAQVTMIDFHISGWRLRELAGVPMRVVSGGEAFGVPWPQGFEVHRHQGASDSAVTQAAVLRLHAPVTVAFDLPAGTRRIAFDATLDDHQADPHLLELWADMTLRIDPGQGREHDADLPSHRFNARSPHAGFNLPVHGQPLLLHLEPNEATGPVMARLRIENALLLTRDEARQ